MRTTPYILNNQSLIDALGGEEEMVKLGSSVAMDLEVLLKPGRQFSENCYVYKGSSYELVIFNYPTPVSYYPTPVYYPYIKFLIWSLSTIVEIVCQDIGENETRYESLLRVKNWFHEEVFPAYLESNFT